MFAFPSSSSRLPLLCLAILSWLLVATSCAARGFGDVPMADAHVHLLDFLQNGDYLENGQIVPKKPGVALRAGQRGKRIEAVLWAMDRAFGPTRRNGSGCTTGGEGRTEFSENEKRPH